MLSGWLGLCAGATTGPRAGRTGHNVRVTRRTGLETECNRRRWPADVSACRQVACSLSSSISVSVATFPAWINGRHFISLPNNPFALRTSICRQLLIVIKLCRLRPFVEFRINHLRFKVYYRLRPWIRVAGYACTILPPPLPASLSPVCLTVLRFFPGYSYN